MCVYFFQCVGCDSMTGIKVTLTGDINDLKAFWAVT